MALFNLFNKKPKKKKAVVYIDFEHWFIGLDNYFHIKPDILSFKNELDKNYDICDIFVFADFQNPNFNEMLVKLREVTNSIVETNNGTSFYKKDFTDFIMLDYIYQKAYSDNSIDCFIIFTGDGHFTSVVNFLKNKCSKEVGIFGVSGAISQQLTNSASWYKTVPDIQSDKTYCYNLILKNFDYINHKKGKRVYPTFKKTVDIISEYYHIERTDVENALSEMICNGYIYYRTVKSENGRLIKILCVNWKRCVSDNLWKLSGKTRKNNKLTR